MIETAAKNGNLSKVIHYIEDGNAVDQSDMYGTTPLHVAAMYGQTDVCTYLIDNGANINAEAYAHFSVLDLSAIYAPNIDTVSLLLANDAQSSDPETLGMILFSQMIDAEKEGNYEQFDLNLSKLEVLIDHDPASYLLDDDGMPITVFLQYRASISTEPEFYGRTITGVETINQSDALGVGAQYLLAKNLLLIFPSDHTYTFSVGSHESQMRAEGHFAIFPLYFSAKSVDAFTQQLPINTPFQQEIFKDVTHTLQLGAAAGQKAGLYKTSEAIYEYYNEGNTVLLPSNWHNGESGHTINIILNKDLNLFIVANGGESHPAWPSGVNAYHPTRDITVDDIYFILTNSDRVDFEFKLFYDLGLVRDEDYSIETASQSFGNCAWYTQQVAEVGLLFLAIHQQLDVPLEVSKTLTIAWFNELTDFQKTMVLNDYLDTPSLEPLALSNILSDHHTDFAKDSEKQRTDLLLNYVEPSTVVDVIAIPTPDFSPELDYIVLPEV